MPKSMFEKGWNGIECTATTNKYGGSLGYSENVLKVVSVMVAQFFEVH